MNESYSLFLVLCCLHRKDNQFHLLVAVAVAVAVASKQYVHWTMLNFATY
jgi:hypothetical protein